MSFSRACLPINEDCSVVAFNAVFNYWLGNRIKNFFLRSSLIKNFGKLETVILLGIIDYISETQILWYHQGKLIISYLMTHNFWA
jgi:hypothetical protein